MKINHEVATSSTQNSVLSEDFVSPGVIKKEDVFSDIVDAAKCTYGNDFNLDPHLDFPSGINLTVFLVQIFTKSTNSNIDNQVVNLGTVNALKMDATQSSLKMFNHFLTKLSENFANRIAANNEQYKASILDGSSKMLSGISNFTSGIVSTKGATTYKNGLVADPTNQIFRAEYDRTAGISSIMQGIGNSSSSSVSFGSINNQNESENDKASAENELEKLQAIKNTFDSVTNNSNNALDQNFRSTCESVSQAASMVITYAQNLYR